MLKTLSLIALLLPVQPGSPANLEVQKLADGVYAVIRTDPPGVMFEANSGFIVGDDGVVVIDGGSNPTSAKAVLAAIRKITDQPVRVLIKTHWHDDHMMGSAAYPEAEIVAHVRASEDMATQGVARAWQQASVKG